MNSFQEWFEQQDFYPKMRYIHGDALFINENNQYRILPVQMIYQTWQQWQTQLVVYKEDMQKDAEALASCQKFLEAAIVIESGMLRLKAMQDFIKRHFPNPVLADGETWVLSKEDRDHNFVSSHELGLDCVVNVCVDCGHQEQRPYVEGKD